MTTCRPAPRRVWLTVALVALFAATAADTAGAQATEPEPANATTTAPPAPVSTATTTPPTTAPPTTSGPTTTSTRLTTAPPVTPAPPAPTPAPADAAPQTPLPPDAPAPAAPQAPPTVDADDGSQEPPPQVAVPPSLIPRVLSPIDQAVAKVLDEQMKAAQVAAGIALAESQAADRTLVALEAEQTKLQQVFENLDADHAAAAQRLVEQRQHMRTRAVARYVAGPSEPVIPAGGDIHEFGRRRVLVQALQTSDRRTLDQYLDARDSAGVAVDTIVDRLEDLNGKVLAARADSETKSMATQNGFHSIIAASTGERLAIGGFAFPVAEPHSFASTFGAPRSGGRLHQGNDIFAPHGTPLYAVERAVVSQMGTNSLGGIKLWITGESGTSYYYAHLAAFAPGLANGTVVEPGNVVGFVGNTGNAITTPSHLHFEIHPGGGPAIDPYPILKAAASGTKQMTQQAVVAGLAALPPAVPDTTANAVIP